VRSLREEELLPGHGRDEEHTEPDRGGGIRMPDAGSVLHQGEHRPLEDAATLLDEIGGERLRMHASEERERSDQPASFRIEAEEGVDQRLDGTLEVDLLGDTTEATLVERLETIVIALVEIREQCLLAGETRVERADRPPGRRRDVLDGNELERSVSKQILGRRGESIDGLAAAILDRRRAAPASDPARSWFQR
jgi:hypothetical protein